MFKKDSVPWQGIKFGTQVIMFRIKYRRQSKLELVSVHIPKCAGTSFRFMLKEIYGDNAVARLDIMLKKKVVRFNEEIYFSTQLPKNIRVIHGHFSPQVLNDKFEIPIDVPYITWLRNPVDRVISNYYYLEHRLKDILKEEERGLNILSKMQRSLWEYAKNDRNRNRISKFLMGRNINKFRFVGVQEYFEEDVKYLSKQFEWNSFELLHYNSTPTERPDISSKLRLKIEDLNKVDMELYQQALNLRVKRMGA